MRRGFAFDPRDPVYRENPGPVYRRLRERHPFAWSPVGTVVSRHCHVRELLENSDFGHARSATRPPLGWLLGPASALRRDAVVTNNGDAHARLRRALTPCFRADVTQDLAVHSAETTSALLDAVGERFDLMADLARPLAAAVVFRFLGIPEEDRPRLTTDMNVLVRMFDITPSVSFWTARRVLRRLYGYFGELIDRRVRAGSDDLLSELARGSDMTRREVVANAILLLDAGVVTTAPLIGNAVLALLERPPLWADLRARGGGLTSAFEELARFAGPVRLIGRIALRPTRLGGRPFRRGSRVSALLPAANRDPEVFSRPDRIDLDRRPNPHLAFGHGAHHCIGGLIARGTVRSALAALAARYPDLTLDEEMVPRSSLLAFDFPERIGVRAVKRTRRASA